MAAFGTLEISRHLAVLQALNKWTVTVDGEPAGAVANGEPLEVRVGVGTHTLRLGGGWFTSPTRTFTIRENETVRFACHPGAPTFVIAGPWLLMTLFKHDLWIRLTPA
jgi:hypothetical protein